MHVLDLFVHHIIMQSWGPADDGENVLAYSEESEIQLLDLMVQEVVPLSTSYPLRIAMLADVEVLLESDHSAEGEVEDLMHLCIVVSH